MKGLSLRLLIGLAGLGLGMTACGQATSSSAPQSQYRNIWVINADGTGEAELVKSTLDLSSPHFSPDGTQITLDTSNTLSVIERRSDIYIASVNADTTRAIASSNLDESAAQWSPDGTKIAFEADGSIWVLTMSTSATVNIATGHRPIWSPNGQNIAYEYDGVRVVSANGSGSTLLGANGSHPAWFSTGAAIAYDLSSGSSSSIIVATFPGGVKTALASGHHPTVAPGSTWVTYERDGDLFSASTTGNEVVVAISAKQATFSPNGTQLAYVYTGTGSDQIAVLSVSATANSTILCAGSHPSWSPNSLKLVFEKGVLR